jgi:hypothetical protein
MQRAAATGGNFSAVWLSPLTHDHPNAPNAHDVWLNGIWFASLGLTLSAALVSGLAKQWMHYYVADATGTPRARACIRQYRLMGLSQWKVPWIIEILPVVVNTSVLLFFFGLVLFTLDFTASRAIRIAIILLTCIPFVFYFVSSALPIWYPQCPYKTSLTRIYNLCIRFTLKFLLILAASRSPFMKYMKRGKSLFRQTARLLYRT